jgi:hypothetical protein
VRSGSHAPRLFRNESTDAKSHNFNPGALCPQENSNSPPRDQTNPPCRWTGPPRVDSLRVTLFSRLAIPAVQHENPVCGGTSQPRNMT